MANTDIPIKEVVNVSITTTPTAPSRAGFGTLLLCTQETSVGLPYALGIKYYNSLAEVTVDFISTTETYKAATAYFSQDPKPNKLAIATRYMAAQGSQMLGGLPSLVSSFNLVTSGTVVFSVSTSGTPTTKTLTGMNFSADATYAAIATKIQTHLRSAAGDGIGTGATGAYALCTFTHNGTQFVFTSGTTGVTVSINYCVDHTVGTHIASMIKMKQGETASKLDGIAPETSVSGFLERINAKDGGWYAFAFTKETRDRYKSDTVNKDVVVAAAWAQTKIKQFFTVTNLEPTSTSPYDSSTATADLSDTASNLKGASSQTRTFCIFSSKPNEYPEISAFARAATTDFDFPNSTLTLKFKKLPGISAEVLTSSQLSNLTSKGCNVYITVGGFEMLSDAMMTPGQGTYQDTVHGIDWLQNAIETNVFGYLATRPTKVPNTDAGAHMLAQQLEKALNQAVNNGLIAEGYDADDVYYPRGFSVTVGSVKDVPLADRQRRIAPPISFICIGAGAIHNVTIKGLFNA